MNNQIVQQGSDFKVLSKLAEIRLYQDRLRIAKNTGDEMGAQVAGSALAALSSIYLDALLTCAEELDRINPDNPHLKSLK